MPGAAVEMNSASHFRNAAKHLRPAELSPCTAWTLGDLLATCAPSSLAIFRCISELTRAEALEVLACLSLRGREGIPAAIRISAVLRSSSAAWEILSEVIELDWSTRDLALLAINFGTCARFSRDWSACVKNAVEGNEEAKVAMAALLETSEINFQKDCLQIEGPRVTNWDSQGGYENEPSLGRELAWCFFAAQCQMAVEASMNCVCTAALRRDYSTVEQDWLQPAEPGNEILNKLYFRMFGVLMKKRSKKLDEAEPMRTSSQTDFAFTRSVREVFYQFACLSSSCNPIILEGPYGCGKSALLSRLAHITSTGFNSPIVSDDNVCFVHMDTAANKEDSNDFLSLVGCVVPLPDGGGFRWRLGPIGHAILNGQWLVLESMDCDSRVGNACTSALVSKLASVRPGDEFQVPSRSEPLRVGLGFRLIATRTVKASESEGNKRWAPPGGWEAWQRVSLPTLSEEEQASMLNLRFPSVADCVSRVLRAISGVRAKILRRGRTLDREPSLREAVRICQRLVHARNDTPHEFSPELALLETLDTLVLWASDEELRKDLIAICSEAWSLPVQVGRVLMSERSPPVLDLGDAVQIGRSRSLKSSKQRVVSGSRKLAMTKHTARVLERIARCISVGESALLNGETGTGKTATLQELARLSNKELVVVNMSQQSDIGDLLGGFRPFEMAAVLPALVKRFDEAFCKHLSIKKNARFLDALHKAARSQKQCGRALRLMRGAIQAIRASVRTSDSDAALEWTRISRMVAKLEKLMPGMDVSSASCTKLQVEQREANPPPRKRQRSNPKIGKDAMLVERMPGSAVTGSPGEGKKKRRQISFEYSDGVLVSALRAGHWVLLDEINLAPMEVLDHLVSLLDHRSLTILNEEGETIHAAEGFALFAAMNPPTDFGKRPLAKEIRSRVTEFFIEDIENKDDIAVLVSHRLFGVDVSEKHARRLSTIEARLAQDIAEFYLAVRALAKNGTIDDASGKCARFSLRTLSIMLSHAANLCKHMTSNTQGERRAAFEGALLAFSTPLPRSARGFVDKLALQHLMHQTHRSKKGQPDLFKEMQLPKGSSSCTVAGFPIETLKAPKIHESTSNNFVVTAAVNETLVDVCRALTYGVTRVPILLQGPTSAGKTSLVSYLASLTGNTLIRINNHEHTDLAEYLGCYIADDRGSLVFREGPLVRAVREGLWVVLDELNLAPPEVLESLNRLLDDNKEIRIPETGEVVKAHKNFTLFATQNPPGVYGGRKELSRAFRGRFIEIQVDELPDADLIEIIERRCRLPTSFAKKMVAVMRELQTRRRVSRLFSGKSGFVTARDLFRWGARRPLSREDLAVHGFFLLGERARNVAERDIVREVLVAKIGVDASVLNDSTLYRRLLNPSYPIEVNLPGCDGADSNTIKNLLSRIMYELQIANTPHMARMITLLLHCASNNEPALLVGPTGSGKTSACSLLAAIMKAELLSVNCHRHTESSDLVGGFRPGRRSEENAPLFEWTDGPLVQAMKSGHAFLMDEINMADDAVVERLNAVLEPSRTLMLSEKGSDSNTVVGHANFRIFATMNPGGDFGKKELSPALRNRFTEIWIPSASALEDFFPVVQSRIIMNQDDVTNAQLRRAQEALRSFLTWMSRSQQSGATFSNSNFIQKKQSLSLRDVTTWSNFIHQATTKCGLHAMVAFAHGARLVFLDGMSVGANAIAGKELETELWSKVLAEVPVDLREMAKKASLESELTNITSDRNGLHFGPFLLKSSEERKSGQHSQHTFCMAAPCTLRNSGRVVRALAVDSRPILLEGPPGAGKTSLVGALARAAHMQLSRINLSESTEMSDLIGGDIPGPVSGQFCFRKGELLRAVEGGFWVLLDEMNLASQSVLEGLNSLLDHRRSVFIPELASEIVAHPDFRIFAAQNPAREGCGRRGLPQSFLNRFTKVAVEAPSDDDLVLIATATHPRLEKHAIADVVRTLSLLKVHFESVSGGESTSEFGLRQVLRWCRLLDVYDNEDGLEDDVRTQPDAELCFDVIVSQGLANSAEREAATSIFRSVFNHSKTMWPQTPSVRIVNNSHVRVGWAVIRKGSYLNMSSLGGFCQNLRSSRTRCLQAMAIVVNAGWPCIVSGESGYVSVSETVGTVESFAALSGQKLLKLKGGSFLDADDLLGGYTQKGIQGELCKLRLSILSLYNKMLSSILTSQPLPNMVRRSLHDFEASIAQLASAETGFEPNEHGQLPMKSFVNVLSESVTLLTALADDDSTCNQLWALAEEIELISSRVLKSVQKAPPTFCWERSQLVHAIERGDWVVIEDADQCSPSVLDRLNPLLELSARAPSYKNLDEKHPTHEPVLLPEAPPNPDGSPAVICPHPNFRLFLVVDDSNGQRISRAIVDRSIKLKLVKETSASDKLHDILSGSKPNPLTCVTCKSKTGDESLAPVTDESLDSSLQIQETNWHQVPELRAVLSTVCTGMADFCLQYEHSLRMRDMHLLYLMVQAESSSHDLKDLEDILVSSSCSITDAISRFGSRPKEGEQKVNSQSNFPVSFKAYLLESLSQMFLLGCTSSADFSERRQLLSSMFRNRSTASIDFVTPTGVQDVQNRTDFCLDPVYGFDSVCPSRQEHFRVTKGQFAQAICLRFDIIVISHFLQSWKDIDSNNESFSYGGDDTPFFGISKRQSNVSGQELQPKDAVSFLGSVVYKVLLRLVYTAQNFRSEVIPNDLDGWTFPEEPTWLQLFKFAQKLLDFSRMPCNSTDRTAYGMVLLRQIHNAVSVLGSDIKNPNLRLKLHDLAQLCGQRAKYEFVRPALPIPRTESGLRLERDLMILASQESSRELGIARLSVPKALVNLSTPVSENDEQVSLSILSLKCALQDGATNRDLPGPIPEERIEFPLWKQIMWTSLADICLTLLILLQESEVQLGVDGLSALRSCAEQSLLEFSINPVAPLQALVPVQRIAWILSSGIPHATQISELINEGSLSSFMVTNRKYEELSYNRSPEYLFCQSVASDTLANSLLSFHLIEDPAAMSITSHAEVAAACTLVSGQSFTGEGLSSQRLLRLRYLANSLYSLGLLYSGVGRKESLPKDERNVLPSLILAQSICEEVASSPVLSMLKNYGQVQSGLRNASGLIEDTVAVRTTPHALLALVSGFLWVVNGVIRVQKAFSDIECLHGIDPSSFAEAEFDFLTSQCEESASLELACNASSVLKLGGDDLEASVPKLRAVRRRKTMSEQAIDRKSEIIHRPKDFTSFSVFLNAVARVRALLSEQSLIWKLFDISLQGSFMSGTLNFVQQQLRENVLVLLEKSCASLEIGGELSHFRDVGGTVARGLREVQHGALLSLKGLSVAISEASQEQTMKMKSLEDLLQFPRAAFSDGSDSLEIVNRLKVNRLRCDVQAKAIRFLFLHGNGYKAYVLPAVRKCFSALVADWKTAQLKEESEEAVRNSLFVIRENARVEDMPGMSELHSLENEEEEDFDLHFNVNIAEVDELVVGIGRSETGEEKPISDPAKSSETVKGSVLDVSDFWNHHASCFLHSWEDGVVHQTKEKSFVHLLSALGGIANETKLSESDSGISVAALASCILSSRVSGGEQLYLNEQSNRRTYNFYKDSNTAEVSKMKTALRHLIARIADVQRQFIDSDGKHPVLNVVTDAAERALRASDITVSLGPLVSVLETVLRKADEWQRIFATKALSLEDETKQLSKLALRWRRIEVESWPNLLSSREELAKQRAEKWFYYLYDGLIGDDDNPYDGEENLSSAVSTMDQFLRSSPLGEYETRIQMLLSISAQLESSDLASHRKFGHTVSGLCLFYKQFLPSVQTAISNAKDPLEKKMSDFARLSTWHGEEALGGSTKMTKGADKELEYFRLKARSEKVRRKLHKLCRDADSVLRVPVFNEISKEIQRNGFAEMGLEASGNLAPMMQGNRNTKQSSCASSTIAVLLNDEFKLVSADCPIRVDTLALFEPSSRLSKLSTLCKRMKDIGAVTVESDCFSLKQAEMSSTLLQNAIRSRAIDLRQSCDAGIQVKKRALVELLRALEIVGVSPFEKPSMKLRSEPSFWLGVKSPFRIHGISEKADSLFFKVASRIQRLRAVSDGRVRNADITPDESKKSLSFCSDLFDRAILQRENLIVAVSALNDTKEIVSQMANFHSAADNGVSPSLTLVKSLFDVVNRVDSIQKDVFFALRYAEQELKKAEAISQENVRNLASNKYPVLSIKRCLSAAKASVLVLEKAHSLLLSFMSVKPVVTLLRLSRTTVYLVTQELADSCKASLKHLGVLSDSLQHQLRTAERTSKLSLASSTLRSIVSYVRESIRVCDLELQACSKSDDSAQSEKTAIVTAPILQKCESAIESTLRFAQTIMAKSESVGNENESMHKAEPLNSDKENILQPNILRKGHNMATGASNRTGVLKLKSALVEILEQVNKADRIRNSHDEEIDNGASFSRLEVAVRNLGYFITCYINAFAIPYMRSASSFHMESLGLLKTMTSIFIGIAEEGFCRPPEQEENAEDDTLPSNVDGTGFGDIGEGDASLAKDVSEEVEDEEQLLGMRNENNASNDKNQDQNDVDGDTGVEMTCDFEGELQDVERPEPDNENDKDPDDEEQEKMDEQFGEEPDEKAVDIDERLWNDEDEANDGGKDQKDRDQGEIESGKREQNVTLAARENSENHRPQPESEKQSEKNSRDNDRNADSMEGEEESDGEQQDGEGETGDGAREDDNEDKEEQPKRKQPKMGDNDDAISGEEPEEVQEEDMQMSPLDDEAADGKDASNPRGSDDEGSDMDREEPMVGTNVDGPGQDGESPEPHEEKEGDGLDAPINEDVMNNLEGAPLGDDEDMADAQNPDEPNDGLPLESDKCMDELPPEQSAMDEDPLSESHDDEARLDANDEPPSQNVPEQKNLSNSNPVSGGTKTTPSARHEEDITDNTLLFSNPDPSGASGARNEASANAEEVGSTREGKETGETSTSNSQLETGSRGSNPLPKLEDFESLSVQHDPNPFRALQEGQLGNEWEKRMNVLKDFVKSGDASKDDVGVKHDVPGNEAALHEFVSESENKNDNDKSALGPATEDQHKPLQKASEEPEEDHMDVNPVDGSETGDEPRRNSDANQNRNTSEVPKTSEKADDEVMKPAEEDVVVSDVTTAQAVIEHPLVSAMRQLEDLNIEKSESKEEDNDPRIPNEPESLSKEHEDNDQEMLDADIKGSLPDVTAEASFEETDFCAMWRKLERLTEADAAALCEQLRLVLEPTVRSGLAGSFKTGKRLDMKKVIDFVASDFRRDRIWLRRVRPSKRSYDVLVAIDDSLSMSESGAGALALAGLVLLHSALSKLEVGRVGILRFGADCHIVRDLNESIPIDEDKGGDILSQFSFSEKSTNLQQLLVSSQDLLRQSRGSSSEDDVQLLFIISDGKLDKREELRKQLRLMASENILVAFIVVNSNATEKTNIFSVKQVTYGDDGRMKVTSYMSDFPFQFYTVIHDVKLLPNVLGNALRQWLELMANLS